MHTYVYIYICIYTYIICCVCLYVYIYVHVRVCEFVNSMRDAIRRGAAENKVQKHEERLIGAWRQMHTLRRRYERWCKGDDIQDCTHKQRLEASYQSIVKVLQQNTWIDEWNFLKWCVQARAEHDNINHPAYGMWTADFMLRQNKSRAFLGKYLED